MALKLLYRTFAPSKPPIPPYVNMSSLLCKNCNQTGHLSHNSKCPQYHKQIEKKQKTKRIIKTTGNNPWINFTVIKRTGTKKSLQDLKAEWDKFTDEQKLSYKDKKGPPPPFPEHLCYGPPPPFPEELLIKPKEKQETPELSNKAEGANQKELVAELRQTISKLQSIAFKLNLTL